MDSVIHYKSIILLFLWFIMFPLVSQAGPKTDTVYLQNGDRITGEIKRFEYGILVFKTDAMGTLKIEFNDIKTFYSNEQYTIQIANGLRFFGSIDTSATDGYVNLKVGNFRIPEPVSEIVEIYPVKHAFWKRLDGSIDLGYSYTKASTISQLNFSGNVDYRVEKAFTSFNMDAIFTDQEDRDRIRKQDYTFSYSRFYKKKWFGSGVIGAQQNTELGFAHRYFVGMGVGRDFIHSNRTVLSGLIGVYVSTEKSLSDSVIQSLEGIMRWNTRIFRFNDPEIDITSYFNVFPSFTTWGRYRLEFELKAKIEIFNDFFFGLTFYDNFDSRPIDKDAATNDYGVTTSLGYSW